MHASRKPSITVLKARHFYLLDAFHNVFLLFAFSFVIYRDISLYLFVVVLAYPEAPPPFNLQPVVHSTEQLDSYCKMQ
jgi:hypothetical protein